MQSYTKTLPKDCPWVRGDLIVVKAPIGSPKVYPLASISDEGIPTFFNTNPSMDLNATYTGCSLIELRGQMARVLIAKEGRKDFSSVPYEVI